MTARLAQGLVLDDRYQLEERVGEQGCAALWKCTDTILARTVSVLAMPSSAPETPRVLTAARRAARIRDPRIVQVFDTATYEDLTYVVSEWTVGQSLRDLLVESGPLHPDRAGALVGEVAEALAEAHRMAVSHLRLSPDSLVWTAGGVKVTGVGIGAALEGTVSDDPARTDAEGLGALLYAALTARWPYGDHGDLPAAPLGNDGTPVSPRQVRAGVPPELDATTERALSQRNRRGLAPLATPAAVAEALADFPDPAPLEFFAGPSHDAAPPAASTDPLPVVPAGVGHAGHYGHSVPARPRRKRRAFLAVPAGVALVAVLAVGGLRFGLSGLSLGGGGSSGSPSAAAPSSSSSTQTPAGKQQYPIVAVEDFDPLGDGHEHSEDLDNVKDGTARTVWYTSRYNSAELGNLKPGVGLLFDLGEPKKVDEVRLRLAKQGADLELRSADSAGDDPDDFDTVAKQDDASDRVTLKPSGQTEARYWLVWFTKLPNDGGGYRVGVGDVTFKPAG